MLRRCFFYIVILSTLTLRASASDITCDSGTRCIGVVDVGSTGSRLNVYAKTLGDTSNTYQLVSNKKISPGFAQITNRQDIVDDYLDRLFQEAPHNIPIYFYATGGMRLLPIEQQQSYFEKVERWFMNRPLHLVEAKTISGQEEGLYAWLTIQRHLDEQGIHPEALSVMDMGGASVQIVIPVTHRLEEVNPIDYIDVTVDGKPQTLFIHSFLGLGQTPVINQLIDEADCFSKGYPLANGTIGLGRFRDCSRKISLLVNDIHEVSAVVSPVLDSAKTGQSWHVIGGLAFFAADIPFRNESHSITSNQLLQQAEVELCSRPWAEVSVIYEALYDASRACLTAAYYHTLMSNGYHISPEESIHLVPNVANMDWTLGVVLHKT